MNTTKFVLASPCSPCGVTWLVNCLLELGVFTYRLHDLRKPQIMWEQQDEGFALTEQEDVLKLWLPALSMKKIFTFGDGVEAEWTHEYPKTFYNNCKVILFIRDPRDALLSFYRRQNPQLSYRDFVLTPDRRTLLDKIDDYGWFCRTWLTSNSSAFFRFEDYKKDAFGLLKRITQYMELEFSDSEISRAVSESTFEKGKAAERRYREQKQNAMSAPPSLHNSGEIGVSQKGHDADAKFVNSLIAERLSDLLGHFSYIDNSESCDLDFSLMKEHSRFSSYFDDMNWCSNQENDSEDPIQSNRLVNFVVRFSELCSDDYLAQMGLRDWEVQQLVDQLTAYLQRLAEWQRK